MPQVKGYNQTYRKKQQSLYIRAQVKYKTKFTKGIKVQSPNIILQMWKHLDLSQIWICVEKDVRKHTFGWPYVAICKLFYYAASCSSNSPQFQQYCTDFSTGLDESLDSSFCYTFNPYICFLYCGKIENNCRSDILVKNNRNIRKYGSLQHVSCWQIRHYQSGYSYRNVFLYYLKNQCGLALLPQSKKVPDLSPG